MIRPTLVNLNPIKLKYYPVLISLDKFNGRYNVADDLPTEICVRSEIRDINVRVFDLITKINEAETLVNVSHVILHEKTMMQHLILTKNGKWKCNCKKWYACKKYSWNISENSRHLKGIADNSLIVCDEINCVMDNVSTTNMTNTISSNITSTISISSDDKNVKMALYHIEAKF